MLETTLRLDHEILLPHLFGGGLLPVGEAAPWTRILQQKRREAKNVDVRSEGGRHKRRVIRGRMWWARRDLPRWKTKCTTGTRARQLKLEAMLEHRFRAGGASTAQHHSFIGRETCSALASEAQTETVPAPVSVYVPGPIKKTLGPVLPFPRSHRRPSGCRRRARPLRWLWP